MRKISGVILTICLIFTNSFVFSLNVSAASTTETFSAVAAARAGNNPSDPTLKDRIHLDTEDDNGIVITVEWPHATGDKREYRGFIRFNIKNINNKVVKSANLSMTHATDKGGVHPFAFKIYKVNDQSWSRDTLTWTNMPPHDPAKSYADFLKLDLERGGDISFPMDPSFFNKGDGLYSMVLIGTPPGPAAADIKTWDNWDISFLEDSISLQLSLTDAPKATNTPTVNSKTSKSSSSISVTSSASQSSTISSTSVSSTIASSSMDTSEDISLSSEIMSSALSTPQDDKPGESKFPIGTIVIIVLLTVGLGITFYFLKIRK